MKKLSVFLIAFITITISSCSSSDEPTPVEPTSYINATIDGVVKSFTIINVVKVPLTAEDGTPYTDLHITATKSDEPTASIYIEVSSEVVGSDLYYYFDYKNNGIEYDENVDNSFNFNLSENTANSLKGTFSGKLYGYDPADSATFVEGIINITF